MRKITKEQIATIVSIAYASNVPVQNFETIKKILESLPEIETPKPSSPEIPKVAPKG